MNLRALLGEENAVSPVVGVVLMVGITVILMGVIGAFVLGSTPGENSPNANFIVTQLNDTAVDIRYSGGETAFRENIGVQARSDGKGHIALDNRTDQPAFAGEGVIEKDEDVLVRQYVDEGENKSIESADVISVVWFNDNRDRTDVIESRTLL
jgi:flagellin-like protein